MVLDEIVENVQTARFFTIQADETKDVRKTEQLSVVIRFFAEESKTIQECFLTFIPMEALNAESISKAILGKLEQMGLVQKLIRDKSPMAYYLHCYAHRLNLVFIDTTKVVQQADDFFSLLEQLYIFISNSIVHENFVKLPKEMHPGEKIRELQSLSETRWWARATSCKNVLIRFECIRRLMRQVSSIDKGARAPTARGLFAQMNYNFLQLLHFFTDILSTVNKISEQLQDLRLDLAKACQLISTLQQELECRRNVDMINYNEEVESLCRKCGLNYEEKERRSQRPPDALSDYFVTDAIGKSARANSEKPLHGDAFIQILDCMLSELDRRFSSDAKVIMQGVSALSPTSESFLDIQH